MLIGAATFRTYSDKVSRIYKLLAGALSGEGTVPAAAGDILTLVLSTEEYEQVTDLVTTCKSTGDGLTLSRIVASAMGGYYSALSSHMSTKGSGVNTSITNLSTYLAYYNTGAGGPWNALVSADFAAFILAVSGTALADANIFATVATADAATPGMGSLSYGTPDVFAAGVEYAEGSVQPKLAVSGEITTSDGENLVVTITGTNQAGTTGVTWTATVDAAHFAAGSEVAIIPTDGTSRIKAVSGIAVSDSGSAWTAGSVYVKPYQDRSY